MNNLELKTFNDFTTGSLEFREKRAAEKLIEDIKKEVMKWINILNIREGPDAYDFDNEFGCFSDEKREAIIWFIKYFFNISEEELKNV